MLEILCMIEFISYHFGKENVFVCIVRKVASSQHLVAKLVEIARK